MNIPPSISRIPLEAWIWSLALIGLAFLAPVLEDSVSFCVPSLLGLDFCWGCGLGRSISHAFHGDFSASWASHPLGMVTIGVLIGRVFKLVYQSRSTTP